MIHAQRKSSCTYVLAKKGHAYVKRARAQMFESSSSDSESEEIVPPSSNTAESGTDTPSTSREVQAQSVAVLPGTSDQNGGSQKDDDDRFTCTLCYDCKIEIALADCGHTLCTSCYLRVRGQRCFKCREIVTNPIKLFF